MEKVLVDWFLSSLTGFCLGILFFGGLWLTVQNLSKSKNKVFLILISAVLRMGILLGGIYWCSHQEWKGIVAAMLGVIIARITVIRIVKRNPKPMKRQET